MSAVRDRVVVQTGPLEAGALLAGFCAGRADVGAVVSVCGRVRDRSDGIGVQTLSIEAYRGYTEPVIAELVAETVARFAVLDVQVAHRYGPMTPGETIVFVAVAAVHRREAFQACDYLMDQLKTRAPFWKREDGPQGHRWIEARDRDHADAARWTQTKDRP